jgi:hypothetical protein
VKRGLKLLVATMAFAAAVPFSASAASNNQLTPGTGDHGNVGSAQGVTGNGYDAAGNSVPYTCADVHETTVPGGFQDKQTCTLADGAILPKKPMTVDGQPYGWFSDYQWTLGHFVLSSAWSYTIMPSGQVKFVSFYPVP